MDTPFIIGMLSLFAFLSCFGFLNIYLNHVRKKNHRNTLHQRVSKQHPASLK